MLYRAPSSNQIGTVEFNFPVLIFEILFLQEQVNYKH